MKLASLHEDLGRALTAIRRGGKVNGTRIAQAAREYGVPTGMLGSALSNHIRTDYETFAWWWKSHRDTVDWPQYRQAMEEEPVFNDTPLDNIPLDKVEPPAQPTSSAFQSPPNKNMNRG